MTEHTFLEKQIEKVNNRSKRFLPFFLVGLVIIFLSMAMSLLVGNEDINLETLISSFTNYESTNVLHQIIHTIRIPRVIAAVLVGALLSVSGALMQGMTRNPLADPSLLGVSQGAGFAIAIAYAFFPTITGVPLMLWSFAGAGGSVCLVFLIGAFARGGMTPVKLALAGTAVGALLSSLSTIISIKFQITKSVAFWYAGGVVGTDWNSINTIIIPSVIGIILAIFISRSVTILSFGEDVAKGLGTKIFLVKVLGIVAVLILTGIAVSVAGIIGFVGLIIPHIVRFLVGSDYRLIIPLSAIFGGSFLLLGDIIGRFINPPFETPVSVVTALVGVPFFLYIARKGGKAL